jgi:hypothetical protein
MRFGALFSGRSDERWRGMFFFKVIPDCDGFADAPAIVQLQRGELATRIALRVSSLPILSFHQVDIFGRYRDPFFEKKYTVRAGIRSKRVVNFHWRFALLIWL